MQNMFPEKRNHRRRNRVREKRKTEKKNQLTRNQTLRNAISWHVYKGVSSHRVEVHAKHPKMTKKYRRFERGKLKILLMRNIYA